MDGTHITEFAKQMTEAATGMMKGLTEQLEKNMKSLTKEDAEKLRATMKDSNIIDMANNLTKQTIDFNTKKHEQNK